MKLLIVINPISGGKNKETFIANSEYLYRRYAISYAYFITTGEDDINKLRLAIQNSLPNRVVSVGGDGTTLMTALALQSSGIPFGIIPMGSANGMAKELNVPTNHMEALQDIVMSEVILSIDIIKVNDNYTMHLGDVGMNANMVDNFAKEKSRGWTTYAKHFVNAVESADLFNVTVETENGIVDHKAYSVLIANTRMYGTGAIVNPKGNPHDGVFEIVVVTKRDWGGLINLGLTAINPTIIEFLEEYTETYSVKSALIKFEKPQMLQLDGEVIGETDSIQANIISGEVQYISTNDNNFVN